jgi:S-DNA-T family DNA segregation ATPase FtsK/SpoIIIE
LKQAQAKQSEAQKLKAAQFSRHLAHGVKEGALIGLVALCLYLLLALFDYSPNDPGWSYTGTSQEQSISNSAGRAGAWSADVLFSLLGYLAFLFPLLLAYRAWLIFHERNSDKQWSWPLVSLHLLGFVLVMLSGTGLASLHFTEFVGQLPATSGGILGQAVSAAALSAFNPIGSTLILLALFLSGLTVFTGISWLKLMDFIGMCVLVAVVHREGGQTRAAPDQPGTREN